MPDAGRDTGRQVHSDSEVEWTIDTLCLDNSNSIHSLLLHNHLELQIEAIKVEGGNIRCAYCHAVPPYHFQVLFYMIGKPRKLGSSRGYWVLDTVLDSTFSKSTWRVLNHVGVYKILTHRERLWKKTAGT